MTTRIKLRRSHDDLSRTASLARKEKVYQRILQQCVGMRNIAASRDSIVLCGRYNMPDKLFKRQMIKGNNSLLDESNRVIFPSMESIRSIRFSVRTRGSLHPLWPKDAEVQKHRKYSRRLIIDEISHRKMNNERLNEQKTKQHDMNAPNDHSEQAIPTLTSKPETEKDVKSTMFYLEENEPECD